MRFPSTTLVAGLAAAGALTAGILLSPPTSSAQDDVRYLLSQDQSRVKEVTITGTALLPDGTPAVKIPVTIKQMSKTAEDAGSGGTDEAPSPELLLQGKGARKGQKAKNS